MRAITDARARDRLCEARVDICCLATRIDKEVSEWENAAEEAEKLEVGALVPPPRGDRRRGSWVAPADSG